MLVFSVLLLIISLAGCMILRLDLIYGLLVGMLAFMGTAVKQGHDFRRVLGMMWTGIRESFIVVGILLIIGAMTGIWRGCGTVSLLVVWGTELIHPKLFILFAFLLPMAVSYLIGTSFGTAATIGAVMMTLCRVSGADPLITAGAVLSGIFFGDRCSPASSCAHLNAYLTGTEIYSNVKAMLKDCIPATLMTVSLYTVLSFLNPVQSVDMQILTVLREQFNLSPLLFLPALIILAAPFIKLNIKAAMGISICVSSVLAVTLQRMSISELLRTLILGFEARGDLSALLSGGGLRSMFHGCIMIIISATFSGIFNGTQMLSAAEEFLDRKSEKIPVFLMTVLTGIPLIMAACNQTLALMLHVPLMRPIYERKGLSSEKLMLDISNSTVLFSALIPWCIACSMPLEMMKASSACIPFAFFLYLPAIISLVRGCFFTRKQF